ncbi:MAG: helix-turn-helix transcriptional regulator [Clostridia bacterium]|nr:helix-turn-helix transcriptional regulator [Clostridia bacterium]
MRKNLRDARVKAGLTQQAMADRLHIGLRHYQKIEKGESNGSFGAWDALEDLLGVHQRILRENQDTDRVPAENP